MINGKQFYHLGRKTKKKTKKEKYPRTKKKADHSHNTHTHIPAHTHTHTPQDTQNTTKQALNDTSGEHTLIHLTIKLHTVHHTTEDLIAQSVDGVHPGGGGDSFQRTLAVKQQPGVSRVHRQEEAAPLR